MGRSQPLAPARAVIEEKRRAEQSCPIARETEAPVRLKAGDQGAAASLAEAHPPEESVVDETSALQRARNDRGSLLRCRMNPQVLRRVRPSTTRATSSQRYAGKHPRRAVLLYADELRRIGLDGFVSASSRGSRSAAAALYR